jgi:hypothetical protein
VGIEKVDFYKDNEVVSHLSASKPFPFAVGGKESDLHCVMGAKHKTKRIVLRFALESQFSVARNTINYGTIHGTSSKPTVNLEIDNPKELPKKAKLKKCLGSSSIIINGSPDDDEG